MIISYTHLAIESFLIIQGNYGQKYSFQFDGWPFTYATSFPFYQLLLRFNRLSLFFRYP